MTIPPLLRTILVLSAGVSAALYAIHEPEIPESDAEWIRRDPHATNDCPGLERQLAAWQRELVLGHWTIEVECALFFFDSDQLLGRARRNRAERTATIWIREGLSLEVQQSVLVHELVHVGIGADRWWVPEGRDEEEFVDDFSMGLYVRLRRGVEVAMLEDFRRAARSRQRDADTGS